MADGRHRPDARPGPSLPQVYRGAAPYAEKRYSAEAARLYGVLDRRLADHEYVADDYSIADIAIWPWISRFEWQEMNLSAYPKRPTLVPLNSGAPCRRPWL